MTKSVDLNYEAPFSMIFEVPCRPPSSGSPLRSDPVIGISALLQEARWPVPLKEGFESCCLPRVHCADRLARVFLFAVMGTFHWSKKIYQRKKIILKVIQICIMAKGVPIIRLSHYMRW